MIQLTRASKGKQLQSLPAMFLNGWYSNKFNTLVDIPVATQKTLLVFSLQSELRKREAFRKLSEKSYLTLIKVVSSALGALDDKSMRKAIAQSGLDLEKEAVDSILTEIRREVTKQISGAGIASILVNDVLSSNMGRVEPVKDLSFASIIDSVSRVQDLYGSFANSETLAVIGEQIRSMQSSVPLIKHIYDVWITFNRHKSATVKGRLTYALDSMYESTFGEEMVTTKTYVSGMHYHVEGIPLIKDMKYRQIVCTYFTALRGLLGIESAEKDVSVKLSELLDHFLLSIPESLPSLPKDLECTSEEIKEGQKLFARIWLMNVYEMILTNDEGQLSHQINNVMDDRKYTRNETWDFMVREGISISSIIFGAYVKTGAMFRDWARNEDIYFLEDKSLTFNVKKKLNKFVFDMVQGYNTFLPLEHTRFLHNPAHIVNYSDTSENLGDIGFFIPDKEVSFSRAQWIITPELVRTLIFKNKKISGTDLDVDMDVQRPLLPLASAINPLLGLTLARPSIFGGDVSAAFLGIQSVDRLLESTIIPGEILRHSELVQISDATDLARTFDVSEEIAEMIFRRPGLYASLSRQSIMFITWDFPVAPVVEFAANDDMRDYVPFVARYPYLLTYSNTLPSISGLTKEKKDPVPNPPAPPAPPAGDKKGGKGKGGDPAEEEEEEEEPSPEGGGK